MSKSFHFLAAFLTCLTIGACSNGSSSASGSTAKQYPTCQSIQADEETFQIVIADTNSATITVTMAYQEETFTTTQTIVFNPGVPQSVIDEECAETKAKAKDYIEINIEFGATCEENTVSMVTRQAHQSARLYYEETAELVNRCKHMDNVRGTLIGDP